MIQLLSLIKQHGHQQVRTAVEEAIALGCADAAAVRHLVEAADLTHARSALIELGALARFERPLPAITDYDGLLSPELAPNAQAAVLETASIQQRCKVLRLPAIAAQCGQLAEQAVREPARTWASSKHCCKPNSRNVKTGWWRGAFAKRICRG
jgi:hypothetical protein